MAKLDRVMLIMKSMTDDERFELFEAIEGEFCRCGEELPDENSKEPDHECEFTEDDEDDEDGDESAPDEEDDDD